MDTITLLKPTNLTARVYLFFTGFNGNSFGCGTKRYMLVGDGKPNYYKSWHNPMQTEVSIKCEQNDDSLCLRLVIRFFLVTFLSPTTLIQRILAS